MEGTISVGLGVGTAGLSAGSGQRVFLFLLSLWDETDAFQFTARGTLEEPARGVLGRTDLEIFHGGRTPPRWTWAQSRHRADQSKHIRGQPSGSPALFPSAHSDSSATGSKQVRLGSDGFKSNGVPTSCVQVTSGNFLIDRSLGIDVRQKRRPGQSSRSVPPWAWCVKTAQSTRALL